LRRYGKRRCEAQLVLTIGQIVKGDKAAQEKLPKVMKDKLKAAGNAAPKGSRSYSTLTSQTRGSNELDMGLVDVQPATKLPATPGLKFEMPSLPLPQDGHVKHRYDPVVEQVTNLLMRHGKKSVAQSVGSTWLEAQLEAKTHARTWP
tara:strand:+ start:23507 stop:23947 length:441 start_codon:yes stop_codon:yes gene_type:complete